jgi:hypothetical protein
LLALVNDAMRSASAALEPSRAMAASTSSIARIAARCKSDGMMTICSRASPGVPPAPAASCPLQHLDEFRLRHAARDRLDLFDGHLRLNPIA